MNAAQMVTALKEKFGEAVLSTTEFRGEQTLHVSLASAKPLLKYCRDELSFDYLVDLSTLDHMGEEPRFEVVYEIYGYGHHEHLRVRAKIPDGEDVPTVCDVWPTANWHEREAWDLYGIRFRGHPDLRRILMYEELVGHPLRKDYPIDKRQPLIEMRPVREVATQRHPERGMLNEP